MCVGVLQMVGATAGGVAYSRDPLGVRADSAIIHSVFGLPKQMVDGADAADFIALDRESADILEHDIGPKKIRTVSYADEGVRREELDPDLAGRSSIDPPTARRIFDLVMKLEEHFGEPQDMEWALSPQGDIVVLQTRPLPAAARRGVTAHELDLPLPASHADGDDAASDAKPQVQELGRGIVASPGVAAGPVHVIEREADMLTMPMGAVAVVKRPLPRFAPALAEAAAIVAEEGGAAGHLASVARELGKPALFGVVDAMRRLPVGETITVDADSMVLLAGRQEDRLQRTTPQTNLMRGSRVHDMLLHVLPHIARLTLRDPQSEEFTARNCKSMHDIFRFCHERALLAMFDFGEDNPFPERAAQLLAGGKSSQFKVIDLGDAFHDKTRDNKIRVEEIDSVPFQAFWRGMMAVPWAGPPPVETRGLASILHEALLNTNLEPSMPSSYTAQNYFMVARDFMSSQSRFGFHFSTVEALVGQRIRENYISFRFAGGAADQNRREARAVLVASLLNDLGFETDRHFDAVRARMDNRSADTMVARLTALGFITMHTRQLDMVLSSNEAMETYRHSLTEHLARLAS
jgi:pyruvate,water dikinase